eukprot:2358528-Rhodomonas_salina.1
MPHTWRQCHNMGPVSDGYLLVHSHTPFQLGFRLSMLEHGGVEEVMVWNIMNSAFLLFPRQSGGCVAMVGMVGLVACYEDTFTLQLGKPCILRLVKGGQMGIL